MTTASWYHCSVKPVSRSAGRSVVAAAAYRLGQSLHDERYAVQHDYTRRHGVEATFTVAAVDAPEWALQPERLWNAAEQAEKRINSTLAREVELALPSMLGPAERQRITEAFAAQLVERYGVAVTVAIHSPGRHGDERNHHAHVLFTTREVGPDGFGKKTRILDDRKTGPQEVTKLRELAAGIINDALAAANSDIRVDHRSFKERDIDRDPTTHLGPAATEMERRGEQSSRGDINREAEAANHEKQAMLEERIAVEKEIDDEWERRLSPPDSREAAMERVREDVEPMDEAIRTRGAVADIQNTDGLRWWQRAALRISRRARAIARSLSRAVSHYWRDRTRGPDHSHDHGHNHDDGGHDL